MKSKKVSKLELWVYKWLPRVFVCHQKTERTLIIKNRKMPICARCTGELIGASIAILCTKYLLQVKWWIHLILLIPLILDGVIQLKTKYESTNAKRMITGVIFGIGIYALFCQSTMYVWNLGRYMSM